jgi:hypothetical protein
LGFHFTGLYNKRGLFVEKEKIKRLK